MFSFSISYNPTEYFDYQGIFPISFKFYVKTYSFPSSHRIKMAPYFLVYEQLMMDLCSHLMLKLFDPK